MKLLLIQPRTEGTILGQQSSSGKDGVVRLSLPVVAALTPPDIEVKIVDCRVQEVDYDEPVIKVTFVKETGRVHASWRCLPSARAATNSPTRAMSSSRGPAESSLILRTMALPTMTPSAYCATART